MSSFWYQLLTVSNIKKLPAMIRNRGFSWLIERVWYNYKYFCNSNREQDSVLEERYPGITKPNAINNLINLELKFKSYPCKVVEGEKTINFIFPQLDPLIMFGGYASYIELMVKIKACGFKVRAVICEDNNKFELSSILSKYPNGEKRKLFESIDIVNITRGKEELEFTRNDEFVSYSTWTSYAADLFAKKIDKKFYFFIQEDESIFHCHDSLQVLVNGAYDLEHYAIFNTGILRDHFRMNGKGVYRNGNDAGDKASCTFEHALTKTMTPTIDELANRKKNRMLIYLRPEDHAKRNLFEIAVLVLRDAAKKGAFDVGEWEFVGVGTLGPSYELPINDKHKVSIISKMPADDYAKALTEFDLGLSLMNAPHPSLLPFEMASSGVLTVTNTYANRDFKVIKSISGNLFPAELNINALSDAVVEASKHIYDYPKRINDSDIEWSNSWDKSFNDEFVSNLIKLWT